MRDKMVVSFAFRIGDRVRLRWANAKHHERYVVTDRYYMDGFQPTSVKYNCAGEFDRYQFWTSEEALVLVETEKEKKDAPATT